MWTSLCDNAPPLLFNLFRLSFCKIKRPTQLPEQQRSTSGTISSASKGSRLAALLLLAGVALPPSAWSAEEAPRPEKTKLLTIGNSFANNSTEYLPALAKAAGKEVLVFRANLGGHSMEQHVGYVKAFEANQNDPKGRPYKGQVDPKTGEKRDFSLKEALESEQWDYVTIQQASPLSFRPETYEPYAGILVDLIHKHAPHAKILVHETWAYREDHRFFNNADFNYVKMYEGLRAAYHKLATDYGLQIIPAGDALQAARNTERWRFQPDPHFDFANPAPGALPAEKSELYAGWKWIKEKKTGKMTLSLDAIHLNPAGRYLGGLVFLYTLFPDVATSTSTFRPSNMSPEDAALLQQIARDAIKANASDALSSRQARQ